MVNPSFLEQPVLLSELIEPDLFTELCTGYADLYRVGIKVFDREGNKIVDVARGTRLSSWLFDFPEAKRAITAFVGRLKRESVDVGEHLFVDDAASGSRFLLLPIVYDFEVLGKLVCGPYVPANADEDFLPTFDLGEGFDPERFRTLRGRLRRLSDEAMRTRMDLLIRSVDALCHAGYRALLTSNMHLESITASYEDLQRAHNELERKNLTLEATNTRLLELDELKSNFLATVSHELRTPLTSVIGYSEMLLENLAGPLNDEQREYVQTIMERGESLLQLISGILDISKIERGTSDISREPVEAETLVENALSSVRPQARKGDVELVARIEPHLPVAHLDRYKVRQALINLLGNAVKFTPAGGRVEVRVQMATFDGRRAMRFVVHDTGIGIPEDQLDDIWSAFHQVDNTSTREYGGTGLGLSIVKSFIEAHGGDVAVKSTLGGGATFSFVLPVEKAAHRPTPYVEE